DLLQALWTEAKAEVERTRDAYEVARQAYEMAVKRLSHTQALVELEGRGHADDRPRGARPDGDISETGVAAQLDPIEAAVSLLKRTQGALHYRDIYAEIEREGILIKSA